MDKVGGFRALALTELVEGILSLIPLLIPISSPSWKWSIFVLSCVLLITGQVIDIASEVFEVDAAQGNEGMLVAYSGIIAVLASMAGGLFASPPGAWIASWSIPAVLLISALSSFASASTRLMMHHDISSHHQLAVQETINEDFDKVSIKYERKVTWHVYAGLLCGSFLLALVPSSTSYILLGLGNLYGAKNLSILYVVTGSGSVVGSIFYAHFASTIGMHRMGIFGTISTVISFAFMVPFSSNYAMMCLILMIESVGIVLLTHAIIVSRQLLLSGEGLARFSGWSRLYMP